MESKIYVDESNKRLKQHNKIIRLSSRESADSFTYSRRSSKQSNAPIKVETNVPLKKGQLKSQDQTFRYAKAQDLQTQRRSHYSNLKQPKGPHPSSHNGRLIINGDTRIRNLEPIGSHQAMTAQHHENA